MTAVQAGLPPLVCRSSYRQDNPTGLELFMLMSSSVPQECLLSSLHVSLS